MNAETLFFVEFVLNAPLYTRYLDELNRDDKSRNKLALDAETGLKCKPLMAEAVMRAVVAVAVIKLLAVLCAYVTPREEWTMWDVVHNVVASGELAAGTAHVAIRRGIAARLPSVAAALDAYLARTAAKRDAVLALYEHDGMAIFMMGGRGAAMIARIFENGNICPQNLTGNTRVGSVCANNDVCESMCARTKDTAGTLQHCSFITASGVAAHQLSGVFLSRCEVEAREKKRARKLGLPKASPRHGDASALFARPIDKITDATLNALLKHVMSAEGHRATIAEPLHTAQEEQAKATLKRKRELAAARCRRRV
jgi:hypothetical protein